MESSEQIFCEYCFCRLNTKNLAKHLKKVHSDELAKKEKRLLKKKVVKYTKTYYQCKQCKRKILKSSLLNHLNKIHGFFPKDISNIAFFYFNEVKSECIKELKSEMQKRFEDTYNELLGLTHKEVTRCRVCSKSVGKKNIVRHFKEEHHVNMSNIKKQIDSVKPKKQLAMVSINESQDLFDRQIKLNGGGYGLGKNRKH
ncbi:hypothetical protein KKI34_17425 [Pseudoalteromonas tetraodonis]|uniref:hypothetical protein n=1 Tax=Pseudoalteromonas tetraodonis TaxID=43659 RepID=UPI001BDE7A49|nr:hypothetical protein [Pseudoalteromonas tetraodonis]MBT2153466.1 hypothetical protein [Pseudoalteromonas tetraodonis]